jgi:hypothetical protein
MNRKVHVRFGGGFVEKCLYGNSPHSHPTTRLGDIGTWVLDIGDSGLVDW